MHCYLYPLPPPPQPFSRTYSTFLLTLAYLTSASSVVPYVRIIFSSSPYPPFSSPPPFPPPSVDVHEWVGGGGGGETLGFPLPHGLAPYLVQRLYDE
jgi:hypothetical protein